MARRTGPTLIELTNTDRTFYPTLGPFLARRDVHKTIGGVPWDDDTKTWLVLKDPARGVLGFCAVAVRGHRATVESLYTADPTHKRVAQELVAAAVDRFGARRDLHAVVRHDLAPVYQAAGFTPAKTTVQFTTLVRPASQETPQ